jgi:cytochrome c-type biogenesis protein CcmH
VTVAEPTSGVTADPAAPQPRSARGRSPRGRLLGWLALAVVLAGTLLYGVTDDGGPRTPGERARNLAESVACPQCDGQSVADSDSEASTAIRERIEERIAAGASDAEIRDELANAYGEHLLLEPGRSGVSSLVWALPVAALVASIAGLVFAFRRWREGGGAQASDADRELVERARAGASTETDAIRRPDPGDDGGAGPRADAGDGT